MTPTMTPHDIRLSQLEAAVQQNIQVLTGAVAQVQHLCLNISALCVALHSAPLGSAFGTDAVAAAKDIQARKEVCEAALVDMAQFLEGYRREIVRLGRPEPSILRALEIYGPVPEPHLGLPDDDGPPHEHEHTDDDPHATPDTDTVAHDPVIEPGDEVEWIGPSGHMSKTVVTRVDDDMVYADAGAYETRILRRWIIGVRKRTP
jgi:hypothetical protein